MKVKVWNEEVVIPTYEVGKPEKNPMFLEKRVYQGSSGVVYPYPVIEKIEDTAVNKSYNAVYLENEYIKVMILPELGGRIQMAYDKIKERHFIYYNNVIKPALVGLTGPWISGGIEFNWPQHHRPSTFLPIDYTIEELPDGGATVWVSERERMFHQYGSAGFTLRPGRAVIEIKGKVYNPTPIPQTFLWWANPAVVVNDDYQSVFPTDVKAVFDHGKRDVATFPIATGTYYKVDYSAGIDISMYKNIPVPTSYMADKSKFDFVGGYENDTKAGLLHVASHHISPGKKQWTWGHGDFGQAWDRNLTDADGPYIELMTGVYTDNQPDFTWLQPYEEKTFTQYFMPYRELGVVKNASSEILLNIEKTEDGQALIKVFATSKQEGIKVLLKEKTKVVFEAVCDISPEQVFEQKVSIDGIDFEKIEISVLSPKGKILLSWSKDNVEEFEIPEPAPSAKDPQDIETSEDLYLTGLHLEQYRHATYDPTAYYKEALSRDPKDIRNNNALGLWLIRHGKFAEAEPYLRTAIKCQMELTPNPYDGEPLYNLGLSLKLQGKYDDAYDNFHKACWNGAWQDSGYYSLAQISVIRGEFEQALEEIDKSLLRNWHNLVGRALKIVILNRLDCKSEALALIEDSLKIDKFNLGALFSKYMITGEGKGGLIGLMRTESHNYCELAVDYISSGLYTEAVSVLDLGIEVCVDPSPMLYYYKGYAQLLGGEKALAKTTFMHASQVNPEYCFPNALKAVKALEAAIAVNPEDSKAYYYLGNLWYDKRQYGDAVACWEKSSELDGGFPTVLRNLSLAYFNKYDRQEEAVRLLEKAFGLDTQDARILMELDQLYKRLNKSHSERMELLSKHKEVVYMRDDLYLEYVTLLNQMGGYQEAMAMIDNRIFHPWEGGEGKVPEQYQIARIDLAKEYIADKKYLEAIKLLEECYVYPHNLGEGKLCNAQENDINYFLGCAYKGLGEEEKANHYYELASIGLDQPSDAMYYNDQKPDKIFYKGLALVALGRKDEATAVFNKLVSYGETHYNDHIRIDYFAVSLPDLLIWEDDLNKRNKIHCSYVKGLGLLGIQKNKEAKVLLQETLDMNISHQGVQRHFMYRFYILLMGLTMLVGCQNTNILQPENFERVLGEQKTELYTIKNSNGCIAQFSNYGGRWLSMWVPDKDGNLRDVILGFDDLEGYINAAEPYHGAITGRVCGRINQGLFNMNGQEYRLANNDLFGKPLKNHLHGGIEGFHKKIWEGKTGKNEKGEQFVEFSYLSIDGEEGYPGNLDVDVRYTLTSENVLRIEFSADTDKNTIVNLTNHAYFNLTGNPSNNVSEQLMQINADNYIACDKELVPTGKVSPLKNSLIDFTSSMLIGKNINGDHSEIIKGKGYAIAYAINVKDEPIFFTAKLSDPSSGTNVAVYSNQPSLQFYNAWLMDGTDIGKGGIPYHLGAGVVLETQGFPDAPNHSNFPSIEITPAAPYYHIVEYRFGVEAE